MTTTVLPPNEFADAMERHYADSADDYRRVNVGLQSESRMADIFEQYAYLYTREQLDRLDEDRNLAPEGDDRIRMQRLWFDAAAAVAEGDVVRAAQELMNDRLAWRTTWQGEEWSINALEALLASETDFDRREAAYQQVCSADQHFAPRDIELANRSQELRSQVYHLDGEVAIAEARMGIDLRAFSTAISAVAARTDAAYTELANEFVPELLGRKVERPSRAHAAWMRSLHPWDQHYSREAFERVCNQTMTELGFPLDAIPSILPDLEDRPEKDPRACVIPVRVPDEVHLVIRPTGGISDYQAFLHEAGHALHFGLTDASLPGEYRFISPDNALTEIYSYVVERITHEPLWHMRHFGLSREEAEHVCRAITFIDSSLFRRYTAKLRYELEFWADPTAEKLPNLYAQLLSDTTHSTYGPERYSSDIDPGLYAADYLRAWRTSEQVLAWLRREHGEEWFLNGAAAPMLRDLFARGTEPTNEDVSRQIGADPNNFDDLARHLGA